MTLFCPGLTGPVRVWEASLRAPAASRPQDMKGLTRVTFAGSMNLLIGLESLPAFDSRAGVFPGRTEPLKLFVGASVIMNSSLVMDCPGPTSPRLIPINRALSAAGSRFSSRLPAEPPTPFDWRRAIPMGHGKNFSAGESLFRHAVDGHGLRPVQATRIGSDSTTLYSEEIVIGLGKKSRLTS
jgi:hypothetical protein